MFARTSPILALVAGLPMGLLCGGASAQPDYEVKHEFDITTRGNLAPHLALEHAEYAYARCRRAKDKAKNHSVDVVGVGVSTFTETATAGTVSVANSEINVMTLLVGAADGEVRVFGDVDLCARPASAYGRAESAAKLFYRGRGMDRRGRIGWVGSWRSEPGIRGGVGKVRRVDPIIGRVFDNTTGEVSEYLLLDVKNFVQAGKFAWEGDVLSNSAPTMEFEIVMPGTVTTQSGKLRVAAEFGVITESEATGIFAGVPVPPVGAPAAFDIPLPNGMGIDYDLPADDTHDIEVELEAGGAGEHEEAQGEVCGDLYIHDDLGTAYEGADPVLIEPRWWLPDPLGVRLSRGTGHMAVMIPPQTDEVRPDFGIVRVAQPGGAPDQPVEALFIRLWEGQPGFGHVVGGDLDVNVAIGTDFANSYMVFPENLGENSIPVKDVMIDLGGLPPLVPGVEYWLEITGPQGGTGQLFSPLSPYHADGNQPSEQFSLMQVGPQWFPVMDPDTGRLFTLPFMLFGDEGGCRPDLNGDGVANTQDFLLYLNLWANGDIGADWNGDGIVNTVDFLEYLNEWVDAFQNGCG